MLPKVSSGAVYGSYLKDYSAPVDSTTDRPASGVNPLVADVAAMTHTSPRAWVRFKPNGTSAPTLVAWDAHWNNGLNAAPSILRGLVGIYSVVFPANVFDEIPSGSPGATPAGFPVNNRMPMMGMEPMASTFYEYGAIITVNPNIVGIFIATVGTSTLVDPNDGTIFQLAMF